jgi:hypothetical protein
MQPNLTPAPAFDSDLENLIHDNIVAVTGIAGNMVRPRFQPEPANHPDQSTDWVAFGLSVQDSDTFAAVTHDPLGNGGVGTSTVERDELITVNLSFYGPNGGKNISYYREGIQLESNRWDLLAGGLGLVGMTSVINLPALLKDKWVRRLDTKITFRRRSGLTYNVPSLLGGNVVINNERYLTTINTSTPR